MDSRDIIGGNDDLHVLIDTDSIDAALSDENTEARNILHYQNHDYFTYLRTPVEASPKLLSDIEKYRISIDSESDTRTLRWSDSWSTLRYSGYSLEKIQDRLSDQDIPLSLNQLQMIDVRSTLNEGSFEENSGILLTEDADILSGRRFLESEFQATHVPGLNIMTASEAAEFIGLFMRYRNEYRYIPEFDTSFSEGFDVTYWNSNVADLSLPHSGGVPGIRTRIENLITGLDELGFQYYKGTGNHTNNYTIYHFNYCISLITGMFDALALHTRDKYNIDLEDKQTTIRTGEPLFKEIKSTNIDLWGYIEQNHPFVELIYTIRPQVIHKDGVMLRGPGYGYQEEGPNRSWQSHIIRLSDMDDKYRENFKKYYEQLDDHSLEYDPLTRWGLICTDGEIERLPERNQFIEPYQFIKTSSNKLIEFVDEYLETIGQKNRHELLQESHPDEYEMLTEFQEYMMSPLL